MFPMLLTAPSLKVMSSDDADLMQVWADSRVRRVHSVEPLILRLTIESGVVFSGSLTTTDTDLTRAFNGWVSFMAAVDQLRTAYADLDFSTTDPA